MTLTDTIHYVYECCPKYFNFSGFLSKLSVCVMFIFFQSWSAAIFLRKRFYLSSFKLRIKYWQNLGSHLSNKNWLLGSLRHLIGRAPNPFDFDDSLYLYPSNFDGFSTSSNKVVKLQVPGAATAREPTRGQRFPLKENPRHKNLNTSDLHQPLC